MSFCERGPRFFSQSQTIALADIERDFLHGGGSPPSFPTYSGCANIWTMGMERAQSESGNCRWRVPVGQRLYEKLLELSRGLS